MEVPYDETFEEFERRTGLDAFFSDYSTEIRGKLLSKNLEKPKDIYDVIYSQVRNENLSKNVISSSNLENDSQEIRDSLLRNFVSNQISLEETGESERKRLESKNKLINSSKSLEDFAEESRKKSIQKNIEISKKIDSFSKITREENLKNNIQKTSNLEEISYEVRENSLNKNIINDRNPYNSKDVLDNIDARNNNLKNNQTNLSNLEVDSNDIRQKNQTKNFSKTNDLSSESEAFLNLNISKNSESNIDLSLNSEDFRNNNKSKNLSTESNLESESTIYRNNSLSNNVKNENDLLNDSLGYKKSNELKNNNLNSNLEENSNDYRDGLLNKNLENNINLEDSSENFRINNLFKNSKSNSNIENDSNSFRKNNESKNLENKTNLQDISEEFRNKSNFKNEKSNLDLEEYSKNFRQEDLQSNVSLNSNLENESSIFREQDLLNNVSKSSNLEFESSVYRQDDLSYNSPSNSDLEQDSIVFRDDDLANNNSVNNSDLEIDSQTFRQDDLSNNSPIQTDLLNSSSTFLNNNLSPNSPINSDLELDSNQFRDDNLISNVSSNSDLAGDSFQYLSKNVSPNISNNSDLEGDSNSFRLNNLYNNISQPTDLSNNSINFRNDNLSNNVNNNTELSVLSKNEREEQQSSNISKQTNVEELSKIFRNEQLSKNPTRFTLGANILLAGTSDFVGVSQLEISGQIYRKLNETLNKEKTSLKSVFDDEESKTFLDEISSNQLSLGGREYLLQKNSINNLNIIEGRTNIIGTYGTSIVDDTSKKDNGLSFYSSPKSEGFITNLISLHNIQQNTFQARPGYNYDSGKQNAIEDLRSFGSNGFQDLLSKTGVQKRLQVRTNTTPANIIQENQGQYLSSSAEKLIKPISQTQQEELGTGVSMASQTDTTDTIGINFDGGNSRRRGVRHIINTIASDDRISFANNFNVQGNQGSTSVFILGKESDGQYKKNFNRYSIKNPYAPQGSETLRFVLTNYSIPSIEGSAMAFPAYIKSFQHGDSATWNSSTFLGRPEPIYTYGSSSRNGSVSFFVLTDFATQVDVGYDFNPQNGEVTKITESFGQSNNFSKLVNVDNSDADSLRAEARTLESSIVKVDESASDTEKNRIKAENSELIKKANELKTQANIIEDSANLNAQRKQTFSEKTPQGENIYKFFDSFDTQVTEDNYIESKAENTVKKLAEMKRKNLFQPSYFSGSKVDFLKRMEFIAKLTRPARNRLSERTNSGFSFSKPPVCHINLGDWLDHDIIINSVSYSYSDAPWTFDGGRVQPMWCEVTLNFNIIGSYGGNANEDPPLSTDEGGYFSRRTSV